MDNQHRELGYGELNPSQIEDMNLLRDKANEVRDLLFKLEQKGNVDGRWLSIARTDIQTGFMAAKRAVAKPDFF